MGNKRKFLPILSRIVDYIKTELGEDLVLGDGFSGSGIVSRLFKNNAKSLYTNDIAGYSQTLNQCYLSTPVPALLEQIASAIDAANTFAHDSTSGREGCQRWVREHWAPTGDIKKGHRAYFTERNAELIDRYRFFIDSLPESIKPFILAPLLVQASIHNNTNGQFSAFYKDANGVGKYGGKKEVDLLRITKEIRLPVPMLSPVPCQVSVSRMDTNEWVKAIPELDMVYYDPPYNKHPYSIYFFLLDIINDWDISATIPDTNRGQPKCWYKSRYNSFTHAKEAFEDLIKNTRSKFILLSYNSGGIIPFAELEKILKKRGKLTKIPVEHKTYRKFQGIAAYKRKKTFEDVKEYLWLLDCR